MTYILKTARLQIRELNIFDVESLSKVLSDKISMQYYPKPFSSRGVENWINKNIDRYKIYGYGLWGVVLRQTGELIGDCGVTIQNIDGELLPEIGFHISPDYCLHGYATEAAMEILKYCRKKFGLRAVYSYCNDDNVPSMKTMIKIGMSYYKKYVEDKMVKVVYRKELE